MLPRKIGHVVRGSTRCVWRHLHTDHPIILSFYNSCVALQAFARLSAVYGGTYMLAKPDVQVVFDDEGKAGGCRQLAG